MKAPYIQELTREERGAAIKLGMQLALSRHPQEKRAQSVGGITDGVVKAIVTFSLATGVPLGIAAHMVGRAVSTNEQKERDALKRISYYRNAADALETGLADPVPPAGTPAPETVAT